jgi:predicted MFS family arabinose efflux permease
MEFEGPTVPGRAGGTSAGGWASVDELAPGRWYILLLLTAVYALNIADRFVMSTLIEPIKADLHLSDSAVGFLTGVALAFFFVTAGLPLAVLADRVNRTKLVAASLAAWSLFTAACGLTRTFWQLMLTRTLVGIGEAGGVPPSQSLLSDYFGWRRRAFAMSIYSVGASLGSMLGSSAGYVSEHWGWRSALMVLGLPGVLLAGIVFTTVKEPVRGRLDAPTRDRSSASLLTLLKFLRHAPALQHALAGGTLFTLWAWGLLWWSPSFLVRSHRMSLGHAGGALSLVHGIGGTAALLLTSLVMGKLANRDARAVPWFLAAVTAIATVPSILAFTTDSRITSLVMFWIFIPLSYALFGPTFALMHNLVPASMRAQSTAVLLFCANVANLIVAPQAVGLASDLLTPRFGDGALRVALIPLTFVGFWAAFHYWRCTKHMAAGLLRANIL